MAFFPELLGSERSGSCSPCVALCLARLSGVRYGRDAVVDQETAVLWRRRKMRDDGNLFFQLLTKAVYGFRFYTALVFYTALP